MKKILVWESHKVVAGGQKMSLLISNTLNKEYEFVYLIPEKGELADNLNAKGIKYYITGNINYKLKNNKFISIYAYIINSIVSIVRGMKYILKEKPDMIYAPGPAALPWATICGTLSKKKVVWHLHHNFENNFSKNLINIMSGFNSVRKIICISEVVNSQIINHKGRKKICVIYNPIDKDYSLGNFKLIETELNIKKSEKINLIHIGLIQNTKNQDIVLKITSLLNELGYNVRTLFIGEPKNDVDIEYKNNLLELAKDENCDDLIFFLGKRDDIPDLFAFSDVVIIPSMEGLSLVMLEAFSAKKPVVCVNVGGTKELALKSNAAVLFDYGDVKAGACAVMEAYEKRETLIQNGSKYILKSNKGIYIKEVNKIFSEYN